MPTQPTMSILLKKCLVDDIVVIKASCKATVYKKDVDSLLPIT